MNVDRVLKFMNRAVDQSMLSHPSTIICALFIAEARAQVYGHLFRYW
jgi:hypothetical protein